MSHPSHAGIYSITHLASGRRYIGSAKNITRRWQKHRSHLRGGKHYCQHLQNAWNKYGESAFRLDVMEACLPSHVILLAREQFWMDKHKGKLFNARLVADSTEGCRLNLTDEEREKRRQCAKANFARCPRPRGSNARLAEGDIRDIFRRYATGDEITAIAQPLGVWKTTVIAVLNRETWDHVAIPDDVLSACHSRLGKMGRKLSVESVQDVRARLAHGECLASIARVHGVSGPTIASIRDGKKYVGW